jgi:hypothetical protein
MIRRILAERKKPNESLTVLCVLKYLQLRKAHTELAASYNTNSEFR